MKKALMVIIAALALPTQSLAADSQLYRPKVQNNGLDEIKGTDVQRGMFGAGYASTLTTSNDIQPGLLISGRYFAGEKWYLLGEVQLGSYSTTAIIQDGVEVRGDSEDALRFGAGAGLSLLQGNASTSGITAVPWVHAAELAVGEQYSGDTSGRYTSLGMSLQFHGERVWTALGTRQFLITDERLERLNSDGGIQWDISLGLWF